MEMDTSQPEAWKIRPCEMYKEEFQDCVSSSGRSQQIFVHGYHYDCSQWETDYKNCCIWNNDKSNAAYTALIKSENTRRYERLAPHYRNNVWQRRTKPPDNWDTPLPDWMEKKYEGSYLKAQSEKLKLAKLNGEKIENNSCCIM